jgi:hypothetical protein
MSRVALTLLAGGALAACAASDLESRAASKKLVHVVAFWLKPNAPKDLPAQMRAFYATRVAREVPGVENVFVGTAHASDRDVVDDSFSCMSVVRFASAAAEAAWQTHPVHDELRQLFGAHLDRVVVYDFVQDG